MSQTKTFSEFLVEQGLITADDLVAVLIEQTKQLPTPAELAREHKLLDSKQLLAVFSHQMKTSVDFPRACQELGFWNADFAKFLTAENDRLRVPVVQILQKSGKLETEALVSALDSYLSEAAKPKAAQAPKSEPMPTSRASVPEAAAKSQEDSATEHFNEYYTDVLQARMITLAKEWDQSDAGVTDALIDRVHGLVGAARFAKLSDIEELFKNAESNIRALSDCATPLPQAAIESFRLELVASFEKGWQMRLAAQEPSQSIEVAV